MLSRKLRLGSKRKRKNADDEECARDESFDRCSVLSEDDARCEGTNPAQSSVGTEAHARQAEEAPGSSHLAAVSEIDGTVGSGEGVFLDQEVEGCQRQDDECASVGSNYVAAQLDSPGPPSPKTAAYVAETGSLLDRLHSQQRDYDRLMGYYRQMHTRYADAKGEIAHLRAQVDALQARLEQRNRRLRILTSLVDKNSKKGCE